MAELTEHDGVVQILDSQDRVLATLARRPYYTPFDFGGKGDGITDDTNAINGAIAAAAGGALFLGGGTWKTSGGHVVSAPTTIFGAGRGTIGAASAITNLSLANGSNRDMLTIASKLVSIKNLGIYGNKANQSGTSRGIVLDSTKALAYITLDDLWIDSCLTSGILLATSGSSLSESVVNRCEVRNNGTRGIDILTGANDFTVSNCQVALNQLSGIYSNGASGKILHSHVWGNGITNTASDNAGAFLNGGVQIIGGQYESNGGVAGTGTGRGIDIRGAGNSVTSAQIYLNFGHGIYSFRSNAFTAGLVLQGNQCYNNSQNGGASGIALDTLTGAVVSGNHCWDSQATKTQQYGYREVGNPNYIACFGNLFRAADHQTGGVLLGTGANNVPLAASIATTNVT